MNKNGNINIKNHGFTTKKPERSSLIGKKGGEISSPQKKLAAKIRGLQWVKKENREKSVKKIVDLILTPEFSAFNLLNFAEEIKADPKLKQHNKLKLLDSLTNIHNSLHVRSGLYQQFNMISEDLAEKMLSKNSKEGKKDEDKQE